MVDRARSRQRALGEPDVEMDPEAIQRIADAVEHLLDPGCLEGLENCFLGLAPKTGVGPEHSRGNLGYVSAGVTVLRNGLALGDRQLGGGEPVNLSARVVHVVLGGDLCAT